MHQMVAEEFLATRSLQNSCSTMCAFPIPPSLLHQTTDLAEGTATRNHSIHMHHTPHLICRVEVDMQDYRLIFDVKDPRTSRWTRRQASLHLRTVHRGFGVYARMNLSLGISGSSILRGNNVGAAASASIQPRAVKTRLEVGLRFTTKLSAERGRRRVRVRSIANRMDSGYR